jgi:hypothetical protein
MKLGIMAVEQQICKDGMHRASSQSEKAQVKDIPQMTLDGLSKEDLTQHPSWKA